MDIVRLGKVLSWLLDPQMISIFCVFLLTDAAGFEVGVGTICLEVGENALINCVVEEYGRNPDTNQDWYFTPDVETVIWSRTKLNNSNSFPTSDLLAEYHYQNGVTIYPDYIGRMNITDTDAFALNITQVLEGDKAIPRYWCQATVQGSIVTKYDYGDDQHNPGIGTPFISNTTCLVKNNYYDCYSYDTMTCALDNFAPNDHWFSLEWVCWVGNGSPHVIVPDPGGYGFDATTLLEFNGGVSREGIQCVCSTWGNSICKAKNLSVEVTIRTPDWTSYIFLLILNDTYSPDLANKTSNAFHTLQTKLCNGMDITFSGTPDYYRCPQVNSFAEGSNPGSIMAFISIYMYGEAGLSVDEQQAELDDMIQDGITAGYFGDPDNIDFNVDYFVNRYRPEKAAPAAWIWIIIAVGVVLVIVFIIACVCCRRCPGYSLCHKEHKHQKVTEDQERPEEEIAFK